MGKGELTRQAILDGAYRASTRIGLEALTLGELADELKLSKGGVCRYFQSKEELQCQVVAFASERFTHTVVIPALSAPPGAGRVRALFEKWLAWGETAVSRGGCFFMAASTEYDDRPGPVRDRIVQAQKDWTAVISAAVREAIKLGDFRSNCDPELFTYEMYGIFMSHHHLRRLMSDPRAEHKARAVFDRLFEAALKTPPSS